VRRTKGDDISAVEVALVTLIFSGLFIVFSVKAVVDGFPAPHLTQDQAIAMIVYDS
jgi:hypothetical protein